METSLSAQKHSEVKTWLHELFGEEVPQFEINQRTMEYLYRLSQESRQQDKHLQLITKDFQQKTAEYNAEADRLCGILQRLQLPPDKLSKAGCNSLATLAKLGLLLDVRDPSNTCYMLALQDLDNDLERIEEEGEAETKELNQLTSSYRSVMLQCNSLQRALDAARVKAAEDARLDPQKEQETLFYVQKEKHYGKEVGKMKAQLANAKMDTSLFHESLVKKSDVLKSIQSQLEPLRAELESYSVLPPDLDASKIKLVEYKKELEQLEKQLSEYIGNSVM